MYHNVVIIDTAGITNILKSHISKKIHTNVLFLYLMTLFFKKEAIALQSKPMNNFTPTAERYILIQRDTSKRQADNIGWFAVNRGCHSRKFWRRVYVDSSQVKIREPTKKREYRV